MLFRTLIHGRGIWRGEPHSVIYEDSTAMQLPLHGVALLPNMPSPHKKATVCAKGSESGCAPISFPFLYRVA